MNLIVSAGGDKTAHDGWNGEVGHIRRLVISEVFLALSKHKRCLCVEEEEGEVHSR